MPDNGKWKYPLRKVLDRETREVKVLKKDVEAHEVVPTEHDDDKAAEEAQNLGIEQKPEVSLILVSKRLFQRNRRIPSHRTRNRGNPTNPKLQR